MAIKIKLIPFAKSQLLSSTDLKKSRGVKRISTNKYSIRLKKSFISVNYLPKIINTLVFQQENW